MHEFHGYWNSTTNHASIKVINFIFEKGKIYGVYGDIGSGKSSLLYSILG